MVCGAKSILLLILLVIQIVVMCSTILRETQKYLKKNLYYLF